MQVKKRLRLNAAFSVLAAAAVFLVSFLAAYHINRAVETSAIAGRIVTAAFERVTLRNDYVQSGSERAKAQWFSKHEEVGRLIASGAEKFGKSTEKNILSEMMADHASIGRIFSAIGNNRERAKDPARMSGLSLETEERLLTQLNMRIYGVALQAGELEESSRAALFSTLRMAGWGIAGVLLLVMTAVIVNSWTMGRSITERIRRLGDGAFAIGGGNLDHRIEVQGKDEFADLSGAFNAMTAKLQGAYRDLENEIGERRRAQEATQELNEELTAKNLQLESANKELEVFIYSVSHDLRQPLRAIASFSQLVRKSLQEGLCEKEKGYLSRVVENAAKMSGLIEDMLKLSGISRQEIKPVEIDMTRMAETIVSGMRETHPERCADVAIDSGLIAVADEGLMMEVLENLLGNAWKFTSGMEKACIEFGAAEQDRQTVFFVRDNGAGFDPGYAKEMFKPFYRLHAESEFEGTGIGLSIVERIINRHGGRVWAEGDVGKGATVFFTVPSPL